MKPTEEELEQLKVYASSMNEEDKYVWLHEDAAGTYIEYAFREGAPHDNRCLSWYDSYQEKAYIRNGWVKDITNEEDIKYLAVIKRNRENRIGQLFRLLSFTCGFEEDSDGRLKESEEIWKKYHNENEPFIPKDHICKVGCPAPKCIDNKTCAHWTYKEPVKCACWNLSEVVIPEYVSIPIKDFVRLKKEGLL